MQNQTTNNLQQQQSGIQGNTPGLQQNSKPATPDGTADVLNNYNSSNGLVVQNQGQPLPPNTAQADNTATVPFALLALIIVPICIALVVFWPQKKIKKEEVTEPEPVIPVVTPMQPKPKKPKGKKKQTKRQRSAKR